MAIIEEKKAPNAKKGRFKRSSNFKRIKKESEKFYEIQPKYGFNKYEAKGLLFDNCRGELNLTYSEAVLLNAIITVTDFNSWLTGTPTCSATNRTLANMASLSKATIPNCLRHLEDKGMIIRHYDEHTNQRVGYEPISLAPFAAKLPTLADKYLRDYVLERRAKELKKKAKAKDVEDQEVYSLEADFRSIYGIDESGLKDVLTDMEKLEADGQYNLWDYMDEVIEKEKVANQEIVDSVKKRNIKKVMLALLKDLHEKEPGFKVSALSTAHKELSSEKRRYELPFNILYVLYAKNDNVNKTRYLGKTCKQSWKLMNNISIDNKSPAFIKKKKKASKCPTLEEVKTILKDESFSKYGELLRLMKQVSEPISALFKMVRFEKNKLFMRRGLFYQKIEQYIDAYKIDLTLVEDEKIPRYYDNEFFTRFNPFGV